MSDPPAPSNRPSVQITPAETPSLRSEPTGTGGVVNLKKKRPSASADGVSVMSMAVRTDCGQAASNE
jgi:hypothetical protein